MVKEGSRKQNCGEKDDAVGKEWKGRRIREGNGNLKQLKEITRLKKTENIERRK